MNKTSLYALTVAASLALGMGAASAADLGGNCCADLEERVAELEATTARKGNRKVSLTISGQVNREILYWNDGGKSNTYFGIDNSNHSSRFGFSGNATVNADRKMGYSILLDVRDKARSALVTNVGPFAEDGTSQERTGATNGNGDHLIRLRDANVWIESAQLGRLTMGRITTAGPQDIIDLPGNIFVVAGTGTGCQGQNLRVRNDLGVLSGSNKNLGAFADNCAHSLFRAEGLRYNSPVWNGFTFNASYGEAASVDAGNETVNGVTGNRVASFIGRNFGADIRYANEFNGVKVAWALGYEKSEVNEDDSGSSSQVNQDYRAWMYSGSLMHVATGLFYQSMYKQARYAGIESADANGAQPGNNGANTGASVAPHQWQIQAGIARNFFGIGQTAFYGEYGRANDWNRAYEATFTSVPSTSDSFRLWGFGMTQAIDAASADLYLGYRNYSVTDGSVNGTGAATAFSAGTSIRDIHTVIGGMRLKF